MVAQNSEDNPAQYVPFKPTPGLHSPHCPNEATLLGISSETRNMIYAYLTEDDKSATIIGEQDREDDFYVYPKDSVNMRHTHAILRVCRQTRAEYHQMFLASNDFVAFVREKNDTHDPEADPGYSYLLDILSDLGVDQVRTIKSLAIVCTDSCGSPNSENYGLIDMWNKFIPALLKRGVQASQLRWPGLCLPEPITYLQHPSLWAMKEDPARAPHSDERAKFALKIMIMAVLYEAIVLPTLEAHGCLTPENPIPDISKQMKQINLSRFYCKGKWSVTWGIEDLDIPDAFNRRRYELEQDPRLKEHWRKSADFYEKDRDDDEEYRSKYPALDFSGLANSWSDDES